MTARARYRGKCIYCGEWWPEGDLIKTVDDGATRTGYAHADCDAADAEPSRRPACQTCWLEHPEGACDR